LTALIFLSAASLALGIGAWIGGHAMHRPDGSTRKWALALIAGVLLGAVFLGMIAEGRYGMAEAALRFLSSESTRREPKPLSRDAYATWAASRIPDLPQPDFSSNEAFSEWQTEFRRIFRDELFGWGEAEVARNYTVSQIARSRQGSLLRSDIVLTDSTGATIPIVVLEPQGATSAMPGVILIPGHTKPGQSGLEQLTENIDSYHHSAARRIAEAGFITLSLELRGFGSAGPPDFPEHRLVAYNALLSGSFYKALIARDLRAAADYFLTLPRLDAERLAIAGVSLGGEIAVAYAALDPRIKAVVFQSYGGGTGNFPALSSGAQQPHYCHMIPGSGSLYRRENVFQLLAPRPTLGTRGANQPFRNREFESRLRAAWAAAGAGSLLELGNVAGGDHEFFVEPSLDFLRRHL